jgi:hypothetical protein
LSDGAHKSEGALRFAGALAARLQARLEVVHAMELTHRSLRTVAPVLHNIREEITAVQSLIAGQVSQLVPMPIDVTATVSLADPLRSMQVRAGEISPLISVIPPVLRWNLSAVGTLSAERCAKLKSPLCIVRTDGAFDGDALLLTHADVAGPEVLRTAGTWCNHITQARMAGGGAAAGEPEVLELSSYVDAVDVVTTIDNSRFDVIAVHMQMFELEHLREWLNGVMSLLLSRSAKTVLLLPAVAVREVA